MPPPYHSQREKRWWVMLKALPMITVCRLSDTSSMSFLVQIYFILRIRFLCLYVVFAVLCAALSCLCSTDDRTDSAPLIIVSESAGLFQCQCQCHCQGSQQRISNNLVTSPGSFSWRIKHGRGKVIDGRGRALKSDLATINISNLALTCRELLPWKIDTFSY